MILVPQESPLLLMIAIVYAHVVLLPQVASPWSAEDCRGLLKCAIRDDNPCVVLENEIMYGDAFELTAEAAGTDFQIPFGQAKVEKTGV